MSGKTNREGLGASQSTSGEKGSQLRVRGLAGRCGPWLTAASVVCCLGGLSGCADPSRADPAGAATPQATPAPANTDAAAKPTTTGQAATATEPTETPVKPEGQPVAAPKQAPAQGAGQASASPPAGPTPALLAARPALPAPTITAQAFAGEPLGVGRLTVEFRDQPGPRWFPDQALHVFGKERRTLYPAFRVDYWYSDETTRWRVRRFDCYFLFRGEGPLSVTLSADRAYEVALQPATDADGRTALVNLWWRHYKRRARPFAEEYGESQMVRTYLQGMLKERLQPQETAETSGGSTTLTVRVVVGTFDLILSPLLGRGWLSRPAAPSPASGVPGPNAQSAAATIGRGRIDRDFDRFLGVLFGTESIRIALQADRMLAGSQERELAKEPLPPPISVQPVPIPQYPAAAAVEPIARYVPAECFYVRCRTVADYFWFRNLVMSWGGTLEDLISMQALDHEVRPRLERQLALSSDAKFCAAVEAEISDMVLIGTDIFFREGAALGVLFEAKDNSRLEAVIRAQRDAAWRQSPEALEREVTVAGHKALMLSTLDNQVRSFYAILGNYHLVTTSQYLAERFFEAGQRGRSLGDLPEFRYARFKVPSDRDDRVFIYVSDPFFRTIVGPQYRIEMTRRLRALTDLQLVEMALLAAKAEGLEAKTLPELIRHGLLPKTFLDRADGSHPVLEGDRVVDSLRGAAGSFLPVPDVPVGKATSSEVRSYWEFANYYATQWRRMDPVTVAVGSRAASQADRERIVLDVWITPYAREHYEPLFSCLDPPDPLRRAPIPGDVITVDARVNGQGVLANWLRTGSGLAFGGLRDFEPPCTIRDGHVQTVPLTAWALLGDEYPVYLGLKNGFGGLPTLSLDRHPRPPLGEGYTHVEGATPALLRWRRAWDGEWMAWTAKKKTLEEVTPQIRLESAERPAQIRFRMGDVTSARLGTALRAICYLHARRISATNAQFLEELVAQLGVLPEEARRVAQRLLGARLVCPLGGDYRWGPTPGAGACWAGTAWPKATLYEETEVAPGYRFALLDWLRGVEIEFALDRTTLAAHIEMNTKPGAGPDAGPRLVVANRPDLDSGMAPPSATSALLGGLGAGESDGERIRGVWEVVSIRSDGEPQPERIGLKLEFTADRILRKDKQGRIVEFKYRLHPNGSPKGIDTIRRDCPSWHTAGAYAIDGDTLTLCFATSGSARRPDGLTTEKGDLRIVGVLTRVRAGTGSVPPSRAR